MQCSVAVKVAMGDVYMLNRVVNSVICRLKIIVFLCQHTCSVAYSPGKVMPAVALDLALLNHINLRINIIELFFIVVYEGWFCAKGFVVLFQESDEICNGEAVICIIVYESNDFFLVDWFNRHVVVECLEVFKEWRFLDMVDGGS